LPMSPTSWTKSMPASSVTSANQRYSSEVGVGLARPRNHQQARPATRGATTRDTTSNFRPTNQPPQRAKQRAGGEIAPARSPRLRSRPVTHGFRSMSYVCLPDVTLKLRSVVVTEPYLAGGATPLPPMAGASLAWIATSLPTPPPIDLTRILQGPFGGSTMR